MDFKIRIGFFNFKNIDFDFENQTQFWVTWAITND
jgi:hypothetical protein